MSTLACPACAAHDLGVFYEVDGVPVNSCVLLGDAGSARAYPRGDLRIAVCYACGFITNTAFDHALTTYDAGYEETQGFSPRFRSYVEDLAKTWVQRYRLAGRSVIEIGCGKGEFLAEMVRAGVGRGVGIDPGLDLERIDADVRDRTTWVRGLFPDDYSTLDADAIVCRHTLEHLAPVGAWLARLRESIGDRPHTAVLFEVPDTGRILDEGAFWDVYYEHCSYFTAGSLHRAFVRAGFDVLDLRRTFDDQYLVIEARPHLARRPHDGGASAGVEDGLVQNPADIVNAAGRFAADQRALTGRWRTRIRATAGDGGAVVWGASSKAVAFLAALGDDRRHVIAAVDINPHKQGTFLAGSGVPIVSPKDLVDLNPALVVAMNPTYVDEIRADLASMGTTPELEWL